MAIENPNREGVECIQDLIAKLKAAYALQVDGRLLYSDKYDRVDVYGRDFSNSIVSQNENHNINRVNFGITAERQSELAALARSRKNRMKRDIVKRLSNRSENELSRLQQIERKRFTDAQILARADESNSLSKMINEEYDINELILNRIKYLRGQVLNGRLLKTDAQLDEINDLIERDPELQALKVKLFNAQKARYDGMDVRRQRMMEL